MRGDCFDDERRFGSGGEGDVAGRTRTGLFNRLMERLWPDLAGKKVVFHEASGPHSNKTCLQ